MSEEKKKKIIKIGRVVIKIIDMSLIIIVVCLIYKGYFVYEAFIRSVIIMCIMLGYKWVGHKIGINRGYIGENMKEGRLGLVSERENDDKLEWMVKKFIKNKWCKKYPVILEAIFWMFRMVPWNWPRNIVIWMYAKIYDVVIIISSNIDLYYEKRNIKRKQKVKIEWRKYLYIIQWTIVYPLLRMFFFPKKIRKNIFIYLRYRDLIRIRVFVYMYSIMYLFMGLNEYINIVKWEYIIIVYFFFAIWWPLIIKLQVATGKVRDRIYYKPEFVLIMKGNSSSSITLCLFIKFLKIIDEERNSFLSIKYLYHSASCCNSILFFKFFWCNYNFDVYLKMLLNYEKSYGVSSFAYIVTWKVLNALNMINIDLFLFKEGLKEFGESYMKKYKEEIEKIKELYKCRQFFMMDIRRLLGYGEKEWLVHYNEYLLLNIDYAPSVDKFINDLNKYKALLLVGGKYGISLKLYKKMIKYAILLGDMQWSIRSIGYGWKGSNDLVYELAKKNGFEVMEPFNIEEEKICYKEKNKYIDKLYNEGYTRIEEERLYDFEFFDKLISEIKKEYKKEYTKLTKVEELISEKYILEYIDKYVLK